MNSETEVSPPSPAPEKKKRRRTYQFRCESCDCTVEVQQSRREEVNCTLCSKPMLRVTKKRRRTQSRVRPEVGTIVGPHHSAWFWKYYHIPGDSESQKMVRLGGTGELPSKEAARDEANRRYKNGDGPMRNTGHVVRDGAMLITEYAEKRFLPWAFREKKPATAIGYRQIYRTHLKAHFGATKLAEYETHTATQFFNALASSGKMNRGSIAHVQSVMSKIFSNAVAEGMIAENPVAGKAKLLVKPKKHTEATQFYTLQEMAAILHALDSDATAKEHAVMALDFIGLRRAEMMGLKWDDIDLAKGSLWVRRSAWMGKVGDSPKNSKSVREVTLGSIASASLTRWQRLAPEAVNGFVFENGAGKPQDLGIFASRHLRPALEAAGVQSLWKGYHSGRRGAETEMQRFTNGNAQTTHHHFGHSVEVAQSHYTGAIPEETKKAALAFDAAVATKIALVANSSQRGKLMLVGR